MTTPGPAPAAPDDPDRRRQALSFGADADTYDRVRPGYPPDAVRWALGSAPLRVLDLGAGTGKLTRLLLELGHDVVAVDPDPGMRARLVRTAPTVPALAGSGEAVPLPDASVDAVLVAQAWHWMDPRRAAGEAARVLRPGGVLVLLWNVRDPGSPLNQAVAAAVAARSPELAARANADVHRDGLDGLDRSVPDARLVADGTTSVDSSVRCTVPDLLALVSTWSYVALSPQRDALLADVGAAAGDLADADGTVELAQSAHVFRFRRT